jgi:hypothetical protein
MSLAAGGKTCIAYDSVARRSTNGRLSRADLRVDIASCLLVARPQSQEADDRLRTISFLSVV